MFKVLIVEDLSNAAELLKNMLFNLFDDIQIIDIVDNVKDAAEKIYEKQTDIVFLDINLGEENGFEVLSKTNQDRFEVIITTAHAEYALKAIQNAAIDFILKPYDSQDIIRAVNRAKKNLKLKNKSAINVNDEFSPKLAISNIEGIQFIEKKRILYLKADCGYSEIKLEDLSCIVVSKPLSHFETKLEPDVFFRVHKSYLVNLQFIKKYIKGKTGYIEMCDGYQVPISIEKKKKLFDLLQLN